MRLDLRLHGHLDDGRKCSAMLSIYCTKGSLLDDKFKVMNEAAKTACWLLEEPGFPDVPDGSNINVEHVEDLNEERAKKHAKMVQDHPMIGMPGSLPEFLRKISAGEMIFPPPDGL